MQKTDFTDSIADNIVNFLLGIFLAFITVGIVFFLTILNEYLKSFIYSFAALFIIGIIAKKSNFNIYLQVTWLLCIISTYLLLIILSDYDIVWIVWGLTSWIFFISGYYILDYLLLKKISLIALLCIYGYFFEHFLINISTMIY